MSSESQPLLSTINGVSINNFHDENGTSNGDVRPYNFNLNKSPHSSPLDTSSPRGPAAVLASPSPLASPLYSPKISPHAGFGDLESPGGEKGISSPSPVRSIRAYLKALLSGHSALLAGYMVLAILLSSANSVMWKRTLNVFRSTDDSGRTLEFFVNQWSSVLYISIAFWIMMYRWWFTDLISDRQKQFPTRKFAVMGALDAASGVCGSIGGAFVSGQLQNLLNQGGIPMTMFMSYAFLKERYKWTQYFGAFLILCGAFVAAYPNASGAASTEWYGLLILLISLIPGSFSNVYKEANLKTEHLDVFYLTTLVTWWQIIIGFAFAPLLSLPGFGGIPLSEVPSNFYDGFNCFFGKHVHGFDGCGDGSAWRTLLIYVVVNFACNTALLMITKHGSAVLLVIASALTLPITNYVFTLEYIMGADTESMDIHTLYGLGFVFVGFLLYSFVSDPETGEIQIIQGPSGQMAFITEEPPIKEIIRRRRSFDLSDSPSAVFAREIRRKKALHSYYSTRSGMSSSNPSAIPTSTRKPLKLGQSPLSRTPP